MHQKGQHFFNHFPYYSLFFVCFPSISKPSRTMANEWCGFRSHNKAHQRIRLQKILNVMIFYNGRRIRFIAEPPTNIFHRTFQYMGRRLRRPIFWRRNSNSDLYLQPSILQLIPHPIFAHLIFPHLYTKFPHFSWFPRPFHIAPIWLWGSQSAPRTHLAIAGAICTASAMYQLYRSRFSSSQLPFPALAPRAGL